VDGDDDALPETVAEANCLLQVAYTQRSICETQMLLAQLQKKESRLRSKLYDIRIDKANQQLDNADENVGAIRHKVKRSGHSDAFKSLYKHQAPKVRKFKG
jgi:hypothetical protein